MAEYLHPGVYVEEKSSGVRPIEGASTSTAGFVGATAKGVPNVATFITTWREFVTKFGDVTRDGPYLPYAVEQFFKNGGKRCYVVRALSVASSRLAGADLPTRETTAPARTALRVNAKGNGAWGNALTVLVEDGTGNPTRDFRLVVFHDGVLVETFDDLTLDPDSDSYVETAINGVSEFIEVEDRHPQTPRANGAAIHATAVTTGVLPNPVVFAAGDTLTLAVPSGAAVPPVPVGTLPAPVTPDALVAAINAAWNAHNLAAFITPPDDPAGAGRLRVRHNAAGYDDFVAIGGAPTGAGQPLAGLAGFVRGQGPAVGASLRSAVGPAFNTSGGNNVLNVTVRGDALPAINLTAAAAAGIDALVGEINAVLGAPAGRGLAVARREGDRIVLATANRGAADARLVVAGAAAGAAALDFRQADGSAPPAGGVDGLGRSEPAFVQSGDGPFSLEEGANLSFVVNNGVAGAELAPVVVSFVTGPAFPNLLQVTAGQLAAEINAQAGGQLQAAAVGKRVIVRQARRGPFYTLRVADGLESPNVRIRFEAELRRGTADGDLAAPAFRPGLDLVAGANEPRPLAGGDDGSPVSSFDLLGTPDRKSGLHAFDAVTDVSFIAIPGASDPGVLDGALAYCGTRQDCFFIADSPGKRDRATPLTDPPKVRDFMRNKVSQKSSYGALYYPWLEVDDRAGAGKNPRRYVPPSGFVAGLFARIDNTRGVWKAPAGTEAWLGSAIGLEYAVTDAEQDILNPVGVNCIRRFADSGIVVWGARTFATLADPEYRYVPVRRYTIYLRQSILRGTQWSVFEPNDAPLWAQLEANIDDFMMGEFRRGALAGATPADAFDVKCDAELNPPSEVNAGRVNMEIAFAPLKPAEFVIIRISQKSQRPQG